MVHQFIIAVFGMLAVWLVNDPRPGYRRFACIFGLLSQPSWLYVTYTNEQFGMFLLAIFFTVSWVRGFYFNWLRVF